MASPAVGTELAIVYVIGAVAVAAISVESCHPGQRHTVAVVAGNVDVSTLERKIGLYIVVEGPDVPGDGGMAGVAAILEMALVRVVVEMAGNAVRRFVRIRLCGMTGIAFLFPVHAVQGESRKVVIEEYRVLPVDFRMAALALLPQDAVVRIVVQVTALAACQKLDVKYRLDMAIVTGDTLVSTEQPVVGMDVVFEKRLIPGGTDVTGIALVAAMPVVRIIFEMT